MRFLITTLTILAFSAIATLSAADGMGGMPPDAAAAVEAAKKASNQASTDAAKLAAQIKWTEISPKYCPITGKAIDESIPRIDQKYTTKTNKNFLIHVGFASAEASATFTKASGGEKLKYAWAARTHRILQDGKMVKIDGAPEEKDEDEKTHK